MTNTASANALSFFALSMSVCLFYSSEFFDIRRNRVFDGYTCPDLKRVFSIGNVHSKTRCFLYCKNSLSCVGIFFQPEKRRCEGCMHVLETELEIANGSLHYTRGGDCAILPSIVYGNISLKSGTHFMDRATVNCDPRFRARPDEISCTSNGNWEKAFCEEYDCFITDVRSYRGKRNITETGITCERWDDVISGAINLDMLPETSFSEAENYCRLPNLIWGHLWCYAVTETGTVMTGCGITKC